MLAAGLPDEAYAVDVLARPAAYVGTEAYTNLMDLLSHAAEFLRRDDLELNIREALALFFDVKSITFKFAPR